jgi:hypothetical protein
LIIKKRPSPRALNGENRSFRREFHHYGCTLADCAFDFQGAAVRFGKRLGQIKAKPSSLMGVGHRASNLLKGLQDPSQVLGRNPDTRINDLPLHRVGGIDAG